MFFLNKGICMPIAHLCFGGFWYLNLQNCAKKTPNEKQSLQIILNEKIQTQFQNRC